MITADELADRLVDATVSAVDVLAIAIGDQLGYYRALRDSTLTAAELAEATTTSQRYTREWLEQQAVSGLIELAAPDADPDARRYRLPPGTREVLGSPGSVTDLAPLARQIAAAAAQWRAVVRGARTGEGLAWEDYGADMRESQADLNAPQLRNDLPGWLAALPELHDRLHAGERLRIADIGCGAGWSCVGLATAFPGVLVDGYDVDRETVRLAEKIVQDNGVSDRVRIRREDIAASLPSERYDLVIAVECLHDMPHPVPVLTAMRELCAPGGAVLVVDEKVAEEFTPGGDYVERLMYGFSVLICLPSAMAGNPTEAIGTVLRPPALRELARRAGFTGVEVLDVEHPMWRFYRLAT